MIRARIKISDTGIETLTVLLVELHPNLSITTNDIVGEPLTSLSVIPTFTKASSIKSTIRSPSGKSLEWAIERTISSQVQYRVGGYILCLYDAKKWKSGE
jgi:hypothetical protein